MRRHICAAARYLWAAPASALGVLLAGLALCCGSKARIVQGVLEIDGAHSARLLPRRFAAITLGHVVLGADSAQLERCRAHERVHVRQYERWGLLFFPLYLASSLIALARGRHPYFDNAFERAACAQAHNGPHC